MLEILFLVYLTNIIGNKATEKGYKSTRYKVYTVVLWFLGEFIGAVTGTFIANIFQTGGCSIYVFALIGAASGYGITYLIVNNLSVNPALPAIPSIQPLPSQLLVEESSSNDSILQNALLESEILARSRDFVKADQVLSNALVVNPEWAGKIAGYPKQTTFPQASPISGYALLVHEAGKAGRYDLALDYFGRMISLNPNKPGLAGQAAKEAGIVREAQKYCEQNGIEWLWWDA